MALNQGNLTKKDSEFIKRRFVAFFLDCFFVFCFALFLSAGVFIFLYSGGKTLVSWLGIYIIGVPITSLTLILKSKYTISSNLSMAICSIAIGTLYYYLFHIIALGSTSLGMKICGLKANFKSKQNLLQKLFRSWITILPNISNIHVKLASTEITQLTIKSLKLSKTIFRILAGIIDHLILCMVVTTLFMLVFLINRNWYEDILHSIQIATIILYYPLFETFFQATPGKALFDFNVLKEDKSKMNFWEANLRQLSKLTIPLTLGWAFIKTFWSKDKITLYDRLTKTRVFKCEYKDN